MNEDQMDILGNLIVGIINNRNDNNMLNKLSNDVKALVWIPGLINKIIVTFMFYAKSHTWKGY